jgi:3-hydroxyacyl-[acyl-carrier-protein] dehydratase
VTARTDEPGTRAGGGPRWLAHWDRLVRLEPGHEVVAVRNIPMTLAVFDSHFPRFPVLPGVVLLAGVAGLAELVLGGRWRLDGVSGLRFRHFVRPGDQVEIAVRVLGAGECAATVSAGGRTVATARRLRLTRAEGDLPCDGWW